MKENIIVCDIDGVICDSSIRLNKYADVKALASGDYNAYRLSMFKYGKASTEDDFVIDMGRHILSSLVNAYPIDRIVYLTARNSEGHFATEDWLIKNIHHYPNVMLELTTSGYYPELSPGVHWVEGMEKFDSVVFKRDRILALSKKYNIVAVLDDTRDVCDMYRSLDLDLNVIEVSFTGMDSLSKLHSVETLVSVSS